MGSTEHAVAVSCEPSGLRAGSQIHNYDTKATGYHFGSEFPLAVGFIFHEVNGCPVFATEDFAVDAIFVFGFLRLAGDGQHGVRGVRHVEHQVGVGDVFGEGDVFGITADFHGVRLVKLKGGAVRAEVSFVVAPSTVVDFETGGQCAFVVKHVGAVFGCGEQAGGVCSCPFIETTDQVVIRGISGHAHNDGAQC